MTRLLVVYFYNLMNEMNNLKNIKKYDLNHHIKHIQIICHKFKFKSNKIK